MNADHAKDRETLCLRGGHVLTFNDDDSVFEEGEVWIENGVITAVGPVGAAPPPSGAAPARHIDAKGRIVMPGLINGHAHSYGALLKGTVDVKPLDIFMLHVIAANVDRSAREVTVSALVDCISMFRTGTTAVIDHFSHRPATTSEALGAVMAAYGEAGMRAMVAPMFSDLPYLETVPLDAAALPAEVREAYAKQGRPALAPYFQVIEEGLEMATQYDGLVNVLLGVDGPQRCSPELLEMTADFQGRHGIGLHSHMLEAKTQAVMAGEVGFVRRFLELGVINDKSSFAHFIWCSDDDIAAAREAGLPVFYTSAEIGPGKVHATNRQTGLADGDDAYEIFEAFAPQDGDTVMVKERASGFYGTPLVAHLTKLGIDSLIVCGESTSGCVRASTVDGYSNGYHMTVVEECVFDRSELSHKVNLFDLHHKYADVMGIDEVAAHLEALAKRRSAA